MKLVVWIAILIAAGLALDRLFLSMEARGWLYWRKTKKRIGGDAIGAALMDLDTFVNPRVRHVVEAQEEHAEESDDGDDERARAPEDRVAPQRDDRGRTD